MNYFLDTEFNELGGELISLALVREDTGGFLYVATPCKDPGPWVAANVMTVLDVPGAVVDDLAGAGQSGNNQSAAGVISR